MSNTFLIGCFTDISDKKYIGLPKQKKSLNFHNILFLSKLPPYLAASTK